MSYDWGVDELEHFTTVKMSECPGGEEYEWLYIIETAAFEARERLEYGHYAPPRAAMERLRRKLERQAALMWKVATLRGYDRDVELARHREKEKAGPLIPLDEEAALSHPLPDATDCPF